MEFTRLDAIILGLFTAVISFTVGLSIYVLI